VAVSAVYREKAGQRPDPRRRYPSSRTSSSVGVAIATVFAVALTAAACGKDDQTRTPAQITPVPRSRTEAQIEATVRKYDGEDAAAGYRAYTRCIRSKGVEVRYRPGVRELLRDSALRKKSARRRDDTFRYFLYDFAKPQPKAEAARFDKANDQCFRQLVQPSLERLSK
jgi:hypothetical protein